MLDLTYRWPLGLSRQTWWLYALSVLILLAVLAPFDEAVSNWARHWPGPITSFFASITDYALSTWILVPSGVLALLSILIILLLRRRLQKLALIEAVQTLAFIFVGVGFPGLVTNVLKRLIGRSRPGLADPSGAFSFKSFFNDWTYQSFPSGHTTTAFATAMVIGFLAPRLYPLGLIYAVAIGISRLAVGAHYPTDAIAGAVLGTLLTYAVRNFFASRRWLFDKPAATRVKRRPFVAIRRLFRARPHPAAAR